MDPILYLLAGGIGAIGSIYSGKAAEASAKAQANELRIQEKNAILNSIAEENEIVRENFKIQQANLALTQGGESDLAVIENNTKTMSEDLSTSKTKSILQLDSLRRSRIGVLQGGKMAKKASLIEAGGKVAGGYAKYKNT